MMVQYKNWKVEKELAKEKIKQLHAHKAADKESH